MVEYNRSCSDEIDHAKADQMHAAALQISKTCFDLKKLCVSVLGASIEYGNDSCQNGPFQFEAANPSS
jgi:hypothetical protein